MPLNSPEVRDIIRLLGEVATHFVAASNPSAVSRRAFELLSAKLGLEIYFSFLLAPDGRSLRLSSYAGIDDDAADALRHLELGQAVCGTVARARERMIAEHVQASTDPLSDAVRRLGVRAYACHPLLAGDRLIGTLSFGTRGRDRFNQAELELMSAVAEIAAIAIDRSTLAERERAIHRQLEQAQENERRRLSRELHDHMGQHLTAIALGLEALESGRSPDWRSRVQQLRALADDAGREAHRVALELRPAALDDLGLADALQNYVDEWSARFGIAVNFDADGVGAVPSASPAEITVYRVVQEALNNVAKHARAGQVAIVLRTQGDSIHVTIEDDGVGFDPAAQPHPETPTLGLIGMHERVALGGGTLVIDSHPGDGATIVASIPLQPVENA